MSWLEKLLPAKIQHTDPADRRSVPEGLWIKCPSCETVLYKTDLEQNQNVCPTCGRHHRIGARARLNMFLDNEGRFEIGQEVLPVDALKFKDSRKYPERLKEAMDNTGETDALVVMGGSVHNISVVAACFEFDFMAGSMGSVVGERFVRGVQTAIEQKTGVKFTYVPYKGGGTVATQLVGGHIDSTVNNPSETAKYYADGQVKPIVAITPERLDQYKRVPTLNETGMSFHYYMQRSVVGAPGMSADAQVFYGDLFKNLFNSTDWQDYRKKNSLGGELLSGADLKSYWAKEQEKHRRWKMTIDVLQALNPPTAHN